MPHPKHSDSEFIAVWKRLGSPAKVAKELGMSARACHSRRNYIEERHGIILGASSRDYSGRLKVNLPKQGIRRLAKIENGRVIIFNDGHIWPGRPTLAMKKLALLCRELKPVMVICNGDIFDGAKISRHDPNGWENRAHRLPDVFEEVEAVREFMDEIRGITKNARHVWNLGNHDIRLAKYLALNAPEVEKLKGTALDDHVTGWDVGWSLMINDNTMVKHRWHGGAHALYNNVMKSGVNMITGHCHQGEVRAFTDYRGRRYACDPGTLLDIGPDTPQTFYAEDSPANHGSGFAVATFVKGTLLRPELCEILNGVAYFRGARV